jgi:hypothetical protein
VRCRVALACIALSAVPLSVVRAQIVSVKTSALAQGDQFTFEPSENRGMAGVSIALRDTLLDPFRNPAAGARLTRSYVFGAPSFYSLSRSGTAGSTLPLGLMQRRGAFFGTVAAAVQVIEQREEQLNPVALNASFSSATLFPGAPTPRSRTNHYVFGSAGRTLGDTSFAVAGSVRWSRLAGVDGVNLLYPGATGLGESGDELDLRLGATKEWATRSLETVIVHARNATTHDVTYDDVLWDPGTRTVLLRHRAEHNYDQRHISGVQMRAVQAFPDSARPWRIGALLTANRTTQPTAPVLGLMNVEGDPGPSTLMNVGVGVAHNRGATMAGVDAIYEPIWAERRWSSGDADTYRFSNAIVRAGIGRDFALLPSGTYFRLQGGAQMHRIQYRLQERSSGLAPVRSQHAWNEWTHTGSASMRTSLFEFHYTFGVVSGVERPGFDDRPPVFSPLDFGPVFPQLRMLPVHVVTQQFSFLVRLP